MPVITITQLKAHLGLTDSVDDATLTVAVNAANAAIVAYCGRSFDKTNRGEETTRLFEVCDPYVVDVDDIWDTTNLAVKTDSGGEGVYDVTWGSADYQLEPLNGLVTGISVPFYRLRAVLGRTFPVLGGSHRPALQLTAAWGWASVPDMVTDAALIKAARLFKRKDSPEGVLGGYADTGAVRISQYEDPDVCSLLAPYRKGTVAMPIGR
ncbi:MAG TPA: phage head-tail connector protein [Mycobacteriales bacterium]|nr:phage head-tail connector protein [Mycobacteriales bacterium]